MKQVDIFTTPLCGYCHAAKRLLTQKGVTYREFDLTTDAMFRADMVKRAPGSRTVPQIFIGDTHVGGCDDLYALESAGKLDPLLAA
jgi:glutaredoxin 3